MASNGTDSTADIFLSLNNVFILPMSTLLVIYATYGIYIVIFGLSIHVLTRQRSTQAARKLYLWCTILLFSLDTLYVAGYTMQQFRQVMIQYEAARTRKLDHLIEDLFKDRAIDVGFSMWAIVVVLMNAVADCTLVHRCYVVWDSRKLVLYPLAFLSFAINAILLGSGIRALVDYFTESSLLTLSNDINNVAFVTAACFNFILTLLTAGRIWWITREARKVMGKGIDTRYKRAMKIVIESGLIYSTSLLIVFIYQLIVGGFPVPFDPTVIPAQLSGLAPTIIIVRAGYNRSVENVEVISTFNAGPGDSEQSMSDSRSEREKAQPRSSVVRS
ncbi:hypothetical protein E1B28_013531 [Marasmius oreades]|uniref:Uncharacterized protein n=1 Tax=Marasmius oreades TaxID=181124 RepID=A0A9P7RQD8_9AGAR|nr:uncharacterized protein E1B28_013531 [Marasmius oreades]KAG7087577.1 hypothetical protein E1B28_013531 [Marasmius oreades]